jgi:hypothetical protein
MQFLDWENYVRPAELAVAAHKARSAATFAAQKARIGELCRVLRPPIVVCMGAGYLNDIPFEDLIAIDADVYFAEWVDGVAEQSFRHDLVTQIADNFVCLACRCSGDPAKYCRSFREDARGRRSDGHCENFLAAAAPAAALCANFVPGDFPRFLRADVTQGVAEHFAQQVPAFFQRAGRPRHAFRHALRASEHPRAEALLPLPDHSVDFITSSLATSQFDFEPYTFFIRNLFQHFGRQAVERDVDALNALVETLRDRLFVAQLEGHCAEMLRLLKPGGRIYFSIEAQHSSDSTEFFLQPDVFCKAMSIIGRHFCFDLQTLPEIVVPVRTPMVEGGESIVQSYLLAARQAEDPAATTVNVQT